MKAFVYERYGPPEVLQLKDIERPTPTEKQVLVRVQAASLNAFDWHMMRAKPFLVRIMTGGLTKPKLSIPAVDISGVVEAVGGEVSMFKPGDEVFGEVAVDSGGLAEFAAAPERTLAGKPANLSFEQAAAVPMIGITALQALRDAGEIQPGHKVLINGASGGVGTFAVQLAKHFEAEVTAVCSTRNLEMARSLGADHVIDYTQENFTRNGKQYDLIMAANGYHPITAYKRALTPNGRYVMVGGSNAQMFQAMLLGPLMSSKGGRQMKGLSAKTKQEDLQNLKELLETSGIEPVIERTYPFNQSIEAMRHIDSRRARGKVVVNVAADGKDASSGKSS
jgi:NADPH:quinone reductase-like Zn-dependent oxidoreductase